MGGTLHVDDSETLNFPPENVWRLPGFFAVRHTAS